MFGQGIQSIKFRFGGTSFGMRLILANSGITQDECFVRMRLATTRCTNALLEEKGIKPALFITKVFLIF